MRQVGYYGRNAVTYHTPVEVDAANPIEERQSGDTKKIMTHHSCQPTK
jgi:hypothetical protein